VLMEIILLPRLGGAGNSTRETGDLPDGNHFSHF